MVKGMEKYNSFKPGKTWYLTTEEFTAIDFTTIFDCSENGMWKIDATLGILLVKKD